LCLTEHNLKQLQIKNIPIENYHSEAFYCREQYEKGGVVKAFVSQNALKTIYYSYFHSVMNYGLLFWGSSTESIKIFKLQKKMIRIMMGCKSNHSCRGLFANLEILPLTSQYIFFATFVLE
jgi:hypothetical protein